MSNHIVWAHHCPVSHERLYSVLDHCPKCGVAQPVAAIPEFDSPAQTIDAQFDRYELWCEDHGAIATLTGFAIWFPIQKCIDELTEQLIRMNAPAILIYNTMSKLTEQSTQRPEFEDTHL